MAVPATSLAIALLRTAKMTIAAQQVTVVWLPQIAPALALSSQCVRVHPPARAREERPSAQQKTPAQPRE